MMSASTPQQNERDDTGAHEGHQLATGVYVRGGVPPQKSGVAELEPIRV